MKPASATALIWVIPVAMFAASGMIKLLAPHGHPPDELPWFAVNLEYSTLLRSLGALELTFALIATSGVGRRIGLGVLLLLTISFSLVIAFNAYNHEFITNCGCFGEAYLSRMPQTGNPRILLLRNAVVGSALLYALHINARCQHLPTLRRTLPFLLVTLSGSLLIAEVSVRRSAQLDFEAIAFSVQSSGMLGRPFPHLPAITEEGKIVSARSILRADDVLLFISPSCSKCHSLGPSLSELNRRLKDGNSRLVFVAREDPATVESFLASIGCSDVMHIRMTSARDWLRLGVTAVPYMVAVDNVGRVSFSESFGQLSLSVPCLERLALVTNRLVDASHQSDTCETVSSINSLLRIWNSDAEPRLINVAYSDGDTLSAAVVSGGTAPTNYIAFLLLIDKEGLLLPPLLVTSGALVQLVDPDNHVLNELTGYSLPEAAALAGMRSSHETIQAPIWHSVYLAITSLPNWWQFASQPGRDSPPSPG